MILTNSQSLYRSANLLRGQASEKFANADRCRQVAEFSGNLSDARVAALLRRADKLDTEGREITRQANGLYLASKGETVAAGWTVFKVGAFA
jgi:hypothetical protein